MLGAPACLFSQRRRLLAVILFACTGACGPRAVPFEVPGNSLVLRTGPSQSMIYLARTSAGLIAIDLGWSGAREALRSGLKTLGADSSQVRAVFVTHAHRDHIEGWPVVAQAAFYLAAPESDFLLGELHYRAVIPRAADVLRRPHLPRAGSLELHEFMADTAIVVGTDTVRAFVVPGHTAGSAAYLFRGVLFAGDALTRTALQGFRSARAVYTEDRQLALRSLKSLFERVAAYEVKYVCTAHTKCAEFTPQFLEDLMAGH